MLQGVQHLKKEKTPPPPINMPLCGTFQRDQCENVYEIKENTVPPAWHLTVIVQLQGNDTPTKESEH